MARKRDLQQFRQACRELGLTAQQRFTASEDLHAEKEGSGRADFASYGELLAWLRQWLLER